MEIRMDELEQSVFYPLTEDYLESFIPSDPGMYMLAIRLVNGTHQTFFTSQTENLYSSLQKIVLGDYSHLPVPINKYLEKFQCYVTYFIAMETGHRPEIEKMLRQTADPVARLKVVHYN